MTDRIPKHLPHVSESALVAGERLQDVAKRAIALRERRGEDFILEMNGITITVTDASTPESVIESIRAARPPAPNADARKASLEAMWQDWLETLGELDPNDLPGLAAWLEDLWPGRHARDVEFLIKYGQRILDTYERFGFSPSMGFRREAADGELKAGIVRILHNISTYVY